MKNSAPFAPVDPAPLRAALKAADQAKQDVADLVTQAAAWKQEHADSIRTGDPRDPDHLRQAAFSRQRLEMVPNYLRKYERLLEPAMNALAAAVRDFDRAFLGAAQAERRAYLEEIGSLLRPYCRDYEEPTQALGYQAVDTRGVPLASQGIATRIVDAAQAAASACSLFGLIPMIPETLADGWEPTYAESFAEPSHLSWHLVPTFEEEAVHHGFNPDGSVPASLDGDTLGGLDPSRVVLAGGNGPGTYSPASTVRHPGDVFRLPTGTINAARMEQDRFERVVRGRAAGLLARFETWRANGSRFVPENFADLGPVMLNFDVPAVAGGHAPDNLGGAPKPGHTFARPDRALLPEPSPVQPPSTPANADGAPQVDLQKLKI